MGRAAMQIRQQGGGLSGDALLKRVLLGYDLMYFLRGAPVVYYGDEVGMMGSGGDKAARQDMFPTQVPEWQAEERVGSPPIGKGSSFDVTDNPIEAELKQLGALRDQYPALSTGWTIVRYAKAGVLVVSRIDPATKREYVIGFNNGSTLANVSVTTATPSTTWLPRFGAAKGNPDISDSSGKLLVTVPALTARMLEATAAVPAKTPAKPKLTVKGDDLSGLWVASASVTGPVSVTFVVRRGSKWQRLDTDTSPPYRGNERVQVAAIARGLDGSTAVSVLVPFRVRAR
jgi:hypothetical protein